MTSQPTPFGAALDAIHGKGSDPYALTGTSKSNRLVRLRDYEHCPERLGEFFTTGFVFEEWMAGYVEKETVKSVHLQELWEKGFYAVARNSTFFQESGDILVLEQDSLILPKNNECTATERDGITEEELKTLQPWIAFQAATQSRMPYTLAVHSGSKSTHFYIRMKDPENWPKRPPSGVTEINKLPLPLQERAKQRQQRKRQEERNGDYRLWYVFIQGLRLILGDLDLAVLKDSGQGRLTRTPLAIRSDNNVTQAILGYGEPVAFADMWAWMQSQLSPEAWAWLTDPYRDTKAKDKKADQDIGTMLRTSVPTGWKDMAVRRISPHDDDEQSMTRQWMAMMCELYPTQCQPVINRRPAIERNDWGDIQASFLWWVCALTVNHLSIPLTKDWAQAPAPMGWVFTENDWWWETKTGSEHDIRTIWKAGESGDHTERMSDLVARWEVTVQEPEPRMVEWEEKNFKPEHAPSFGIGDSVVQLNTPTAAERKEEKKLDRIGYFLDQLGEKALRTKKGTVPFPSTWLGFDGKIWRERVEEDIHIAANSSFDQFPEYIQKGKQLDIKKITERDWTQLSKDAYAKKEYGSVYEGEEFDSNPEATVFENGTLYVTDDKVEFKEGHFDPSDQAYRMLNYPFASDMPTPTFDKFLKTSFNNQGHAELLLQLIGYIYCPRNPFKSFFLIVGQKDSGKSTLQMLLKEIAGGNKQVIAAGLDTMLKDPFWTSDLPTANLITIDEKVDVNPRERKQIGSLLKQLSGNTTISCRRMQTAPFSTEVKAKLVMTANTMPNIADDSDALWDRCIILEPTLPKPEDRDPYILAKLKQELPGIAAKGAEALKRLKQIGQFKRSEEDEEFLREYQEGNSPIREFFSEWMVKDDTGSAHLEAVMQCFNRVKEFKFKSVNKFKMDLKAIFPDMKFPNLQRSKLGERTVFHLPPGDHPVDSFTALSGYRCLYPMADSIISLPLVPREDAGTIHDPTKLGNVVSFPGRVMQ